MDTIDKINYYLVKQGKTGADLSRALGLSNSIYSQWNKKKTKPKKSKLSVIAEYLGVSVADILPDDGEDLPKAEKENAAARKGNGDSQLTQFIDIYNGLSQHQKDAILAVMLSYEQEKE